MQVLNKEKFNHYKTDLGDLYLSGRMTLEVSEISSSLDAGKFPEHLRGNFALIYISPTVTCFAVDHFSTIPLFYTDLVVGTYFIDVLGSMPNPLLNEEEQEIINVHGGYNVGPNTNIVGLTRVEPCTYVWNGAVRRYITLLQRELYEFDPLHCQNLFNSAITRCVGEENALFLSGGKDSSTILGCMLEWGHNVEAISLYSRRQSFSEKKIVERLGDAYNITPHFVETEYSGKVLDNNDRFFSFWVENPFGAKRSAINKLGWHHKTFITGEGGPLVFNHKAPLTYAIQRPNNTINDFCRLLAIDTLSHHKVTSPNLNYIWQDRHWIVERITDHYMNQFESFGDADLTNKLIHLQTVDTCAFRNFAYSQDDEVNWTHPYFDWPFVEYVLNIDPSYKVGKKLFKVAFGDFISTIPWEYPKSGLSIPTRNKFRNS